MRSQVSDGARVDGRFVAVFSCQSCKSRVSIYDFGHLFRLLVDKALDLGRQTLVSRDAVGTRPIDLTPGTTASIRSLMTDARLLFLVVLISSSSRRRRRLLLMSFILLNSSCRCASEARSCAESVWISVSAALSLSPVLTRVSVIAFSEGVGSFRLRGRSTTTNSFSAMVVSLDEVVGESWRC